MAARMSPGSEPRSRIRPTATPGMSPTELRQPQCTAPAAERTGSCSSSGTQSAVKQKMGRPFTLVTRPSASQGAGSVGPQRSASVTRRTCVPCTCFVYAARITSMPSAAPRMR